MRRNFTLPFSLCFALFFTEAIALAQSGLNGRWVTDRPADPTLVTDAQRKQSVQLEVSIEDNRASGTLAIGGLGGTFYTFKDGKLNGNTVQFRTSMRNAGQTVEATWAMELVDTSTVLVSREAPEIYSLSGPYQPAFPAPRVTDTAPAQPGTNDSISGVVSDQSKARIPGVTVTASNVDTGAKTTTLTNEVGEYHIPRVVPGKYMITASLSGFRTAAFSDLSIGDTLSIQNFTLELRPRGASVNPGLASCNPNSMAWCAVLHRAK